MQAERPAGMQRGRPFKPGQPGNPDGRPKGTRNRSTLAAEALLDGEAEALTRKAIELALAGEPTALRLCMERLLPARKDRPIALDLPMIKDATDVCQAIGVVVAAVGDGTITPGEAGAVAKVIDAAGLALRSKAYRSYGMPSIRVSFCPGGSGTQGASDTDEEYFANAEGSEIPGDRSRDFRSGPRTGRPQNIGEFFEAAITAHPRAFSFHFGILHQLARQTSLAHKAWLVHRLLQPSR